MTTVSKLYEKCEKCKYKDSCNEKRMVACELLELSKPNMDNAAMSNAETFAQAATRKRTSITIKMGEYGNIDTSMEQIAEQINKNFQINCVFNKS